MTQGPNPILETIEGAGQAAKANRLPDKLISADSHVTEPPGCYIDHIERAFRERAPHIRTETDGGDTFVIEGIAGGVPMGIIAAAGKDPREIKKGETPFSELHRGGWDGKARLADQDRDGVCAEIIYPSVGMVLCNHPDADYKQACMWAYNRWLQEEFCAADPSRLIGMGQTAVRSVAEAVEDLRRFKEMGFGGVMMPGNPATAEDYDHPNFDPLWRAAVELNMPVAFHILTSRSDGNAVADGGERAITSTHRGPTLNTMNVLAKSIHDIIGLFIWGQVFDRHPDLRVIVVEADAGWAPHFANRLDHYYKRHRFWMKTGEMKKLPSEQFFENIYLTFQDDWVALKLTGLMNPGRLLWANDFPHSDSTWPWSRELLLGQTTHLSEREKAMILHDNAAELFGLAA